MKQCFFLLVVYVLVISGIWAHASDGANVVVFSYNRPLQLELFLRSLHEYVTGIASIHVIYRADTEKYNDGYDILKSEYPAITFIRQSDNPTGDFKELTLRATFSTQTPYIVFAVDDIVVKEPFSLPATVALLEKHQAYGFYLRLGIHITYCYSENYPVHAHDLKEVEPDVFSWTFSQGNGDWGYPHSVDMVLYRKADVRVDLEQLAYTSPNTLEAAWAARGISMRIKNKKGLCYTTTKIVNIPLNRVQTNFYNRSMNLYSPEELLDLFFDGYRIDYAPLHGIRNESPHMEYEPTFINKYNESSHHNIPQVELCT